MSDNPFLITPEAAEARPFLMGTVTSTAGGLFIKLDGEATARTKSFKRLAHYTPADGDRVQIAAMSGTYVVQGEVV